MGKKKSGWFFGLTVYGTDEGSTGVARAAVDAAFEESGADHALLDALRSVDVGRLARLVGQQRHAGRLQFDGVRCTVTSS